jgi:hypothetical protein
MNLLNATQLRADYTMGMQPDGRELLVVVAKGTFTILSPGGDPKLAEEQAPLVTADVFTGEPGFSAPLYESDYAPRKPRCDVLLNGSAHAPSGKPTERVTVSLQVGSLMKSFDVVGNRVWKAGVLSMAASSPEPFKAMPISYNNAFGGVDKAQEDTLEWRYYPLNHAGVGYHKHSSAKAIQGKPLPNTEERGSKISNPAGNYRPMAFGSVGRSWQPRINWSGTYDQKWLEETFPFLPLDFDERYYQSAPEDQQTHYPEGGEEVVLTNLTPQGRAVFRLPRMEVPVMFIPRRGKPQQTRAVLDTIIIEPDRKRLLLTWRASLVLTRDPFEVRLVVVGTMSRGWYRARATGKRYCRSLGEMINVRRPGPDSVV